MWERRMDVEADLRKIFLSLIDEFGISYDPGLDFGGLIA